MAKDNNKKPEKEDFNRKIPARDSWDDITFDHTVVDTLKPPPRIPDNQDNSDESKR